MKHFLKVIVILILSINIQAVQTNKGKTLLDKVVKTAKGYKNMVIDFNYQIYNSKEKINQSNKGTVALEGNKYVLTFMGVTKIFDGKKVYTIVPEDEEVTVSKQDDADANSITPNKIFTFFNKGFKYELNITQKVGTKNIQYVKLTPTNAKDTRKEILIGVDSKTNQIYNLIETAKSGTKTTLTVSTFKTNQKLAKDYFTFKKAKYPGYYINNVD
jgi:outer membrane lipoprotein-sorting protein